MIAGVIQQNWIYTSYIAAVCLIMTSDSTVEGVNTNLSGKQFIFWFILNSFGMSRLHSCRIPVKKKTGMTLLCSHTSPCMRHILHGMEKPNYHSPPLALFLFIFNGKFEIVLSRELSLSHHMTCCN